MSKGTLAAGAVPWWGRMACAFAGATVFAPSMGAAGFGIWRLAHPGHVVWVFHGEGLAVFWFALSALAAGLLAPWRGLSRTRSALAGALLAPALGGLLVMVYNAR